MCSVHRNKRGPHDGGEGGKGLKSQDNLNLNVQPLRGIDCILSHFDKTDLWCAICIIVNCVFSSAFFSYVVVFALLNVLGSMWSGQKFLT